MESTADYHARIRNELSNSINSYFNSEQWKSTLTYWHEKLQTVNSVQSETVQTQQSENGSKGIDNQPSVQINVQPVSFHSNYVQTDQKSLNLSSGQDLPLDSNATEINNFVPTDKGLQYGEDYVFESAETAVVKNFEQIRLAGNLVEKIPSVVRNSEQIVSMQYLINENGLRQININLLLWWPIKRNQLIELLYYWLCKNCYFKLSSQPTNQI